MAFETVPPVSGLVSLVHVQRTALSWSFRHILRIAAVRSCPIASLVARRGRRGSTAFLRCQTGRPRRWRGKTPRSVSIRNALGVSGPSRRLGGSVVAIEQDVIAGDRLDRPGLWRSIDRVRAGEANAVIVHSLDRFGRDQNQQGVAVIEIRRAGGRLLSATERLDEGPMGDFMRTVYGLASALELGRIRERTNRGFDAKFRQTKRYKAAQRPPYGYRRISSGRDAGYEIDPIESHIVRRMFTERAAAKSIRTILMGLNAERDRNADRARQMGHMQRHENLGSARSTRPA